MASWRQHGYRTQFMTGSAWGNYEDYIAGRFDGKPHADEGQADGTGETIWHHEGVPYMVPTPSFVDYLTSLTRRAVDAGAEAVYLEEPEFWSRAGYSEGFKRLWQAEYGETWQRPDSSPDAFWRSSKLKYALYRRTLGQVFKSAKAYATAKGKSLSCYVPTHSLLNYSQWGIVSPETSLMDLPDCDGYIAQVWTGTARTPNRYRGVKRERTFETAYLEYATMAAMTAPTGRTVYFLADPVEDDPGHTWDDYRQNYERTIVASLMFTGVSNYEVMPWPSRVYLNDYPAGCYGVPGAKCKIPAAYAAELKNVITSLHDMEQPDCKWEAGPGDVAVLVSDTMMFQRGSPWCGDSCFDEFYGLALPLVKHGIPARMVVLEQVLNQRVFEGTRVLLMSYEHMKPMRPEYNARLAEWVRMGGVLMLYGGDSDPFNKAREWWNIGGGAAGSPRLDLLRHLGIEDKISTGMTGVGKGHVLVSGISPAHFARETAGPELLMQDVRSAYSATGRELKTTNTIVLRRGKYTIAAVLDESVSTAPTCLKGQYRDLFTPGSDIVRDPIVRPGEVLLLRGE
jgi:hypothetical protein